MAAQRTAAWLFRQNTCSVALRIASDTLNLHGLSALAAAGGHSLVSARSSGLQLHVVPAPTSSRSFSASPTSAAESHAPGASPSSPSRLALPKWLRALFPGALDLPSQQPSRAAASPAASTKPEDGSDKKTPEDEDLKQLEELRDMTMEGYVEYCKKMRSGSAPPRPRQPPVARDHYAYHMFRDNRRIAYLRLQQHERIGSLITKEESELILSSGEEVLRNRALLENIADRTGQYIDLEVKDCIQQCLELRKRAGRFHRYVTEFKNPLPKSDEEQRAALKFMERMDKEAELMAALARRDTATCPLKHKLAWAGPTALCDLTGLRYTECCGQLSADKVGAHLVRSGLMLPSSGAPPRSGRSSGPAVDEVQRRASFQKFKGRAEARLRKAFLESTKPRFRDY